MWFRGDNVTRNYTVDASHLGVKRLSTGELKLHKICWDGIFFSLQQKFQRSNDSRNIQWYEEVCKEAACTCTHCILLKMI